MQNPYEIIGLESQDVNKKEILEAQMRAMKEGKYNLQEIHNAVRQLLNPAKRLAADFMFPKRIKSKRPQKIKVEISLSEISLDEFDENSFDSLK